MTTIREYLTSRLAAAEELAQYREFKVDVSIVSIEATGNSVTPTRVTMKMIQKFILYNGQERIILEKYETILAPNSLGFRIPAFQNETKGNSDSRIFQPLNTCINEVVPILNIITQISSSRKEKEVYLIKNEKINKDILEAQQNSISCNSEIIKIKPEIEKFNIKDNIGTKSKSPEHRSHILIKIWNNSDDESNIIKAAIKEYGVNPNYINNTGESLVSIALASKDDTLLDLLIASKIDFNSCIGNKIVTQLILESANQSFITKMFASNLDLSKSVLTLALRDDANSLAVVFSHKPELTETIYPPYPLLVLALKNGCYKSAEQILKANLGTMQQVFNVGVTEYEYSALSIMIITGDKAGIELLKAHGANLATEVKSAVTKEGHTKYLMKILTLYPEMIDITYDGKSLLHLALELNKIDLVKSLIPISNTLAVVSSAVEHKQLSIINKLCQLDKTLLDKHGFMNITDQNGNNLLHLACRNGNTELVEMILQKGLSCLNKQNNEGQTALHILSEGNLDPAVKVQIARTILKLHPDLTLKDTSGHTPVELAYHNAEFLSVFEELGLLGMDTGH